MRFYTLAAAAVLSTVSAAPAFAMNGYAEKLAFVSEIKIDGEKMENDLCLLQKESVAFWMTYHTEPLRYVLGSAGCTGDTYGDLTFEAESVLNGAGLLPELPPAVYHTIPSIIAGFLGMMGLSIIALSFIARIVRRR